MDKKQGFLQLFTKTFLLCVVLASLGLVGFYGWQFYQKTYQENIALKNAKNVGVKEAIEINFSVPVWKVDYARRIKIVPDEKVSYQFDQAKRKLIITPEKFWKAGMDYTIVLPDGRTAMFTKISAKSLTFSVSHLPQVIAVFPANGEKEVIIGAEDPIVIDFDKSTKDYYIDFAVEPNGGVEYQNNPEKTQFKILPRSPVEDGKKYTLKISAKVDGDTDANYVVLYDGAFETLKTAPVVWEKDYALRLDQAKKYTKAKIQEGKYIDVNLATQIMSMFENGVLLDAYLISSGKRGMDTPVGTHQIYNKTPRAYSKAYGLYMPNWMAIVPSGKYGIHELPEWPGGYKEGANHLGIPVSHGCMRLGVGPAKIVYDWAEVGTPVIVY